ncbi:uncharacterized protein LOC123399203 [Hordeum vulgare subsp. vulgare]|uniref:uncharacterized protein LOC123399203 n=1 Tax=Hordeum vulgare subsp. vulgare TaxID=112509 RepID=UPI001D1A34FE|nr:uncharacterized protein LOC123399203 [Hordeum vulgare subsp. vulgare]KAI4991852.1 hypothetical protein ZWY2020_040238 [Hordeum vulgare]
MLHPILSRLPSIHPGAPLSPSSSIARPAASPSLALSFLLCSLSPSCSSLPVLCLDRTDDLQLAALPAGAPPELGALPDTTAADEQQESSNSHGSGSGLESISPSLGIGSLGWIHRSLARLNSPACAPPLADASSRAAVLCSWRVQERAP